MQKCKKKFTLRKGFYVRTCQSNGTDDVCIPCDANTYLLDPTNSSYPLPCVKAADCPPGNRLCKSLFKRKHILQYFLILAVKLKT